MVGHITANDLKVKGISAIDDLVSEHNGVVITVHGKQKYVVISMEEYSQLREYELDAAIQESKNDIENGMVYTGTIEEHIKRITNV
ncbi:MAG: type II toxin-antitoxin system prevent-host-death family antitoxin [Spirochaetia bacterium]|jgi:prevent-host-death family protein|nr:type II toxin-antitoxin system prevent-host-death family antitoxin [Spirochaetia bacterium]